MLLMEECEQEHRGQLGCKYMLLIRGEILRTLHEGSRMKNILCQCLHLAHCFNDTGSLANSFQWASQAGDVFMDSTENLSGLAQCQKSSTYLFSDREFLQSPKDSPLGVLHNLKPCSRVSKITDKICYIKIEFLARQKIFLFR